MSSSNDNTEPACLTLAQLVKRWRTSQKSLLADEGSVNAQPATAARSRRKSSADPNAPRERPILFSAPMIRALLAETKTQTRRIVKPQPAHLCRFEMNGAGTHALHLGPPLKPGTTFSIVPVKATSADHRLACPYGAPGDRLWVRETWYCDDYTAGDFEAARVGYVSGTPTDDEFVQQWREAMDYRATHDCKTYEAGCPCRDDDGGSSWRPSIFMPRWASRITLELVDVRVQRLLDITEDDARAEGVEPVRLVGKVYPSKHAADVERLSYRSGFADIWRKINGCSSWDENPWVWAITFKRAA